MWISHVLQMILLTTSSRSDYNTNKGTGYIPCLFLFVHLMKRLCSFYFSGSQTRSTYIHLLCTASSGFNSNGFHVRFPHFIRSSMWMTYIISEISTFFTNCAFSHDSTSLTLFFNRFYSTRWSQFLQVKKTENRKILFRTSKTGRNIAVFRQYLLYEQNRMYRYDFLWKLQKCYERA